MLLKLVLLRYDTMFMGMFFQNYDPRVEYFNGILHRISDTGITNGLFGRALPYINMKSSIQVKEEALILQHFIIPLLVCLAGLLIGLSTFAAERSNKIILIRG